MSGVKMPEDLLRGTRTNMPLMTLARYATTLDGELLGFRLPPFQRPPVWSKAQKIRFIESAWLGFSLGEVVITQTGASDEFDRLVIDGQQRLTALRDYLADEFPVLGSRWSEVGEYDRRRFSMTVTIGIVWLSRGLEWEFLRDLYIRMNYGGTAHAPEHHPDTTLPTPEPTP